MPRASSKGEIKICRRIENLDSDTSAKRVPPRIRMRLHPASHAFGARKNKSVHCVFNTCSPRVEDNGSPIILFVQEQLGSNRFLHHKIVSMAVYPEIPRYQPRRRKYQHQLRFPLQRPGKCSCTKNVNLESPRAGSIAWPPRIRRMGNSQRAYRSASAGVCASQHLD